MSLSTSKTSNANINAEGRRYLFYFILYWVQYPTLASSFRRKPESRIWMPAYAGMTNTSLLAARIIY
jgi:hypothetical protein